MSLRLFVARQSASALYELDTLGVSADEGVAFVSRVDGHPVAIDTTGDAKLRQITQWVSLLSDCTVRVTPLVDEVALSDQAYTIALRVADGTVQRIEAPMSARGRRFGARVEVLAGTGTALGEASLAILPKRSQTGGDV